MPWITPLVTDASTSLAEAARLTSTSGFQFTGAEKKALIAFLRTLTDERFVSDPRFSGPFR